MERGKKRRVCSHLVFIEPVNGLETSWQVLCAVLPMQIVALRVSFLVFWSPLVGKDPLEKH